MTHAQRLSLAAFLFCVVEALLMFFIDRPLSEYLRTIDQDHHTLINVFRDYTDLGLSKYYQWVSGLGAIACALILRLKGLSAKRRIQIARLGQALFFFFICVTLAGILTDIIKFFVGRARPVLLDREGFYGFSPIHYGNNWHSWPSGHATTAFALACTMIILVPRGRILWLAFALAIMLSRIMVNAHYLSDTLAGAVVGTLTVLIVDAYFNRDGINHFKYRIYPIDSSPRAD